MEYTKTAYDLIRADILLGALKPGERLRVVDLNARYKSGLTPIREALVRLSSEGLVEAEANRGAKVRNASLEELQDITETRIDIETWCLTRAIERGDDEWEAEIVRSLHLLSRAPTPSTEDDQESAAHWEMLHRQFHYALVAACGSEWKLKIWNMLMDHSERYRNLRLLNNFRAESKVKKMDAEHAAIATAVINRDTDKAVELIGKHLSATKLAAERLIQKQIKDAKLP
ncbi:MULTISPECIES: GntR family transcriptional regulator [Pacificibacter]|uniref:GntR family transcriptional regulator n=1 Tax=Pacificibacter TaxID=1042323 RepID=UPI001C09FE39|nr:MULTISPECIES: FCD domain-containing protein [Pacificibacter]MBU2935182.1 FCD domain-containing protein [Pacificibacter marinus]MDO6615974.1 FCD domain-containing protein [Pacificibacter sp. 1_MG-2023]